ncbi:hypothetical protein CR513_09812, partial [Mucuna pruriens]
MSENNVTVGGHCQHFLLGIHLKQLLKYGNELSYSHRGSVAQIVNPKLGRSILLPPTSSALVSSVQRPQTTLHNIINVGEVPRNGPSIRTLKHAYMLTFQNILSEEEISHIGPTPRPINSEEPQSSNGKTVNVVISVSNFLPGLFGGGVQACGPVRPVSLREGNLGIKANPDKARDVAVNVRARVLHRIAHPSLGREMHHVERPQEGTVVDVAFYHEDAVPCEEVVVDADDAISAELESNGDVCPHETGCAGDQDREGFGLGGGTRGGRFANGGLPVGAAAEGAAGVGSGSGSGSGSGGGWRSQQQKHNKAQQHKRPEQELGDGQW